MSKLFINSFEELEKLIGKDLGVSDYLTISQEQINRFADATLDHQWIHVDVEKAKAESPFKNTIAHGYLTVSLLPYFWAQIIEVGNLKMQVNYGMDKFKFNQAVTVNSRIRLHAKLNNVVNLRGVTKAVIGIKMEIEGNSKPAFEGDIVFLYYFH